MTKILSFAPQWDILKAFYSDFDSGRKYGCVEKWQRKKFSSSLEIKLFSRACSANSTRPAPPLRQAQGPGRGTPDNFLDVRF
jgi:hypothetical protein